MAANRKRTICDPNGYCPGVRLMAKLYRAWDVRNSAGKVGENNATNKAKSTESAATSSKG
ncbi:hypothetical protein LIN78_13730 [Leeia sp. TBRC 13508]|uniref:Uncharacterized protein n=1 Tax=Leeia speluncae TaxID=2884804 RepID=A0ABS8D8Z9_9NEIS|nr:hypothetical protein [Leeia speluncae]MCB6184602.1 hypothetical protein [Leeia speluncae]